MQKTILLIFLLLIMLNSNAQIRFINVDPVANELSIKNFDEDAPPVDITSHRIIIAGRVFYTLTDTPLSIKSGSLLLTGGDTIVFSDVSIPSASYMGLYLPGSGDDEYTDSSFMLDYVQWEIGGGAYESTAMAASIWSAGEFISGNPPYYYIGNGLQNGASFWSETSLASLGINIRLIEVNPKTNRVQIKNFGADTFNISDFRLSSKNKNTNNLSSQTLISGSLNVNPGDTTIIELSGFGGTLSNLDTSTGDLALYKDGNYTDTNSLLDFLQWGSDGNGNENIAFAKGIWDIGDFIEGKYPYYYLGNGIQNGSEFWLGDTNSISISDTNTLIEMYRNLSFNIYPNPINNGSFIIEHGDENEKYFKVELFNIQGKSILKEESIEHKLVIQTDNFPAGDYFLFLCNNKGSYFYEKILIQ